jgi:lipopolysaccharide/colanic/teichoic acid biosynthesis glycosyltransferase
MSLEPKGSSKRVPMNEIESTFAVVREPVFRRRGRRRYATLDGGSEADAARGVASAAAIRRPSRLEANALRILNVVFAAGALVILSPLIGLLALLVRLDSPGPVFYRQQRVGLDRRSPGERGPKGGRRVTDMGGQPFMITKFRSMRVDAEKDSGPVWAEENDPRVTRVGRFLRRTRLDELPQFWNVLKGDMSIVGPRPERPQFVRQLRNEIGHYPLRHQVPPGITGWAQVNRRADQTVDDVRIKIDYDLEYLQRRSLWFDIWIMLKTFPVMFERDHPSRPKL